MELKDQRLQWLLGMNLQPTSTTSGDSQVSSDVPNIGECYEESPAKTDYLKSLLILSWNIDGLCDSGLVLRSKAVIQTILVVKPDAVYLQEVVDTSEALIRASLSGLYHIVKPKRSQNMMPYYCLMVVAKHKWKILMEETVWFPGSSMGRHLLDVLCESTVTSNRRVRLMTSHLESLAPHAEERIEQFKTCCELLTGQLAEPYDVIPYDVVIFGGDLNARDNETNRVLNSNGVFQRRIIDCWDAAGRKSSTRFTWDLKLNDNIEFDHGSAPRLRFDRIYFFNPSTNCNPISLSSFQLVGNWRISNGMFPSDHFGILATFKWEDTEMPVH